MKEKNKKEYGVTALPCINTLRYFPKSGDFALIYLHPCAMFPVIKD